MGFLLKNVALLVGGFLITMATAQVVEMWMTGGGAASAVQGASGPVRR